LAESNPLNFSGANRPEEDSGTGTQALPETSALFLTGLPVLSVRPAVVWTRDYSTSPFPLSCSGGLSYSYSVTKLRNKLLFVVISQNCCGTVTLKISYRITRYSSRYIPSYKEVTSLLFY
jgi:hypothetical protein